MSDFKPTCETCVFFEKQVEDIGWCSNLVNDAVEVENARWVGIDCVCSNYIAQRQYAVCGNCRYFDDAEDHKCLNGTLGTFANHPTNGRVQAVRRIEAHSKSCASFNPF